MKHQKKSLIDLRSNNDAIIDRKIFAFPGKSDNILWIKITPAKKLISPLIDSNIFIQYQQVGYHVSIPT